MNIRCIYIEGMKTTLQSWGHSQGIRIPKSLLAAVGWHVGENIEMQVVSGGISLIPVKRPIRGRYNIDELARKMPKGTKTREVDTGKPVGKEVW